MKCCDSCNDPLEDSVLMPSNQCLEKSSFLFDECRVTTQDCCLVKAVNLHLDCDRSPSRRTKIYSLEEITAASSAEIINLPQSRHNPNCSIYSRKCLSRLYNPSIWSGKCCQCVEQSQTWSGRYSAPSTNCFLSPMHCPLNKSRRRNVNYTNYNNSNKSNKCMELFTKIIAYTRITSQTTQWLC